MPRRNELIGQFPDPSDPSSFFPVALGYAQTVEKYDVDADEWSVYFNMTTGSWVTAGCLSQYNGKVYRVLNSVEMLDPITLEITELMEVPDVFTNPGRCSSLTLNGRPGNISPYAELLH